MSTPKQNATAAEKAAVAKMHETRNNFADANNNVAIEQAAMANSRASPKTIQKPNIEAEQVAAQRAQREEQKAKADAAMATPPVQPTRPPTPPVQPTRPPTPPVQSRPTRPVDPRPPQRPVVEPPRPVGPPVMPRPPVNRAAMAKYASPASRQPQPMPIGPKPMGAMNTPPPMPYGMKKGGAINLAGCKVNTAKKNTKSRF